MRCTDERIQEFYGQEYWGKAIYREIVEPERIVYTNAFADEKGNLVEGMPEMLATLTFTEHEGKTKLTCRTRFTSVADLQSTLDMGIVEGMTQTWDRLDDHLKEIQKG